jgi:hypothetical protein
VVATAQLPLWLSHPIQTQHLHPRTLQGYGDRQYMIATAYRCVMVRRGIPMSPMVRGRGMSGGGGSRWTPSTPPHRASVTAFTHRPPLPSPTHLQTYAWSCPFEMEFPYPALPPSTEWWPASTTPTAAVTGASASAALAAENAALKARVAELEAQLAATSHVRA